MELLKPMMLAGDQTRIPKAAELTVMALLDNVSQYSLLLTKPKHSLLGSRNKLASEQLKVAGHALT